MEGEGEIEVSLIAGVKGADATMADMVAQEVELWTIELAFIWPHDQGVVLKDP